VVGAKAKQPREGIRSPINRAGNMAPPRGLLDVSALKGVLLNPKSLEEVVVDRIRGLKNRPLLQV